MRLYRAVSEAELDDIGACGVFRPDPNGFRFCKWFAFSAESAVAWGRWFAKQDGLRYYVVETETTQEVVNVHTICDNLDNIGPAVCLQEKHLLTLSILSVPESLISAILSDDERGTQ